jgi:hypothetical protein
MVTRLALMPDGKDLDALPSGRHAVQRNVPGTPVRDHELPQASLDGAADVRVTFEDRHGVHDHRCCGDRSVRVLGSEEIEAPIEVGHGPRAVGDGGQRRLDQRYRLRARLTGFGRCADRPAARATMYACTSSAA